MATATPMTRAQARKATTVAKRQKAAGDQRWVDGFQAVIDNGGHLALGYTSQTAYGAGEFNLNPDKVTFWLRVARARRALTVAGVHVPDRGVHATALRNLSHRHIPVVAELVTAGMPLAEALNAARLGDTPLFVAPDTPHAEPWEYAPAVVDVVLAVERLGFSTPVRDLLDAEAVLTAALAGLTRVVEALASIPQHDPNNETKE